MKSSEYLYGEQFNPRDLQELSYPEALHKKNFLAKELIGELLDVPLMYRDMRRINEIQQAIKFNQQLIAEVYGIEKDI